MKALEGWKQKRQRTIAYPVKPDCDEKYSILSEKFTKVLGIYILNTIRILFNLKYTEFSVFIHNV